MTKKRGQKAKKLWKLIETVLQEKVKDVWYEPIHGPCIEMSGYAGGWYYILENGREDCLGYNFEDAVEMINLQAKLQRETLNWGSITEDL